MLILFNTLTRKKEPFIPIDSQKVRMYSCGPTVYWFAHIGNIRSFLFADLLRRTLEFNDFFVQMIMNITDVGHLLHDADNGEDRIVVASAREGKSAFEIAEFYAQVFFQDLERLNMLKADGYPRATEHIEEQIEMIQAIEKKGMVYQTADGLYFDTSKLENYGQLSGQSPEEKRAGVRVEMGEKKHLTDFALWKFSPESVKREMEWDSPWGKGFPGWHIECSAMAKKYLGVPFDIHTGGVDHIAIHHENEIAQTEAADGVVEARYWMHSEFLTVEGTKMSKSLGNVYTIQDLIDRGFDPLSFRYFVFQAHYRTLMNFTFEALAAAQNAYQKLCALVRHWDAPSSIGCAEFEQRFLDAMNDDLNTPQALALIWELVDADFPTVHKAATLLRWDRVLGLKLDLFVNRPFQVPENVQTLVDQREEARAEKDWVLADQLRHEIEEQGFRVEDREDGPLVIE